ncbi:MAG: hypothetical protein LUI02_00210, partial [Clostridiales bacterium]|nr:hypothetical protein [Clostridiales bacterium]
MDERVLKWITALSGILAVAVCVSLYFFPSIHAQALAAESQGQEEYRSSAEDIIVASEPEDSVEEAEDLDGKLKIALPDSVTEDDVSIENDYLTQTVTVRFAGGVEDYFSDYVIRGSSDHIDSLSYYQDGDDGVIVFALDSVCELEQDFKTGGLYLKFLDPHEVYDKVVVVDAGHG